MNLKAVRNFEKKIEIAPFSECWWFTGSTATGGYGTIWDGEKQQYAHRFSYLVYCGEIPEGMLVRHTCDNRPCVNPSHLLTGTYQDNMDDAVSRKRTAKGVKSGTSKLNPEKVKAVREMLLDDETKVAIAQFFDVSHQAIRLISNGKTWKEVA